MTKCQAAVMLCASDERSNLEKTENKPHILLININSNDKTRKRQDLQSR